jgi:hypothetical protein
MTIGTPQSQAVGIINEILQAAIDMDSLYERVVSISQRWTDDSVANTVNALQTTALNADGSQGTPDVAPNVAHPLNPQLYPALIRAVSANQVAGMLTIIQGLKTYVEGGAVSATASARAILNSACGT